MRIGEWEQIGRSRGLVQRILGELRANEQAAHVTISPDGDRQRILVATDVGLLDYTYAPSAPGSPTFDLRGTLYRWSAVRGMRLQSDAQWDDNARTAKSIWRLVAEEPKIELMADSEATNQTDVVALLDFARACFTAMDR